MEKSNASFIVGTISILCVACCAIAWIGLMLSPPWPTDYGPCDCK